MESLVPLGDGIVKGKGISAILNSREGFNQTIAYFGGKENIPSSIMVAKRIGYKHDRAGLKRSYRNTAPGTDKMHSKPSEGHYVTHSGLKSALRRSGMGPQAGALSVFPKLIGRSVLLLYANPGDVVFDPFAGHDSRLTLCVTTGMHYIGCDICAEFMEDNRIRAEELREDYPNTKIKLHHVDSRKVPVKSDRADFTITSPPYWAQEHYGPEPEQLEYCPTYKAFLKNLLLIVKENFRVLKPGSYAAYFVNDFRIKGKMYFYHADFIRVARKAGFVAHDLMVVDFGKGLRDSFPNQILKSRILPKRHEFAVILRKPS